jgi:hypothetical protein
MTKMKPTGKRVEDADQKLGDWKPPPGYKPRRIMGQFTTEALIRLARKIEAEETAWMATSGGPEPFRR